ncbi:MAG: threonylcarbamoyl-AMP synthase [Elusimicrobia bacterium]|nr:threonylcarbamoyl-AMP synthase [Elusimicrobiota bacterium]MBD3411639.1 threonylcarbamoyl-AMP synthase [Elusimicrobiota bacterium]
MNSIKTRILSVVNGRLTCDEYDYVVCMLKQGEPIILPTDTVYGFAVHAYNQEAAGKVYSIKKRQSTKPLIWFIDTYEKIINYAENISDAGRALMREFWPGPLTVVCTVKDRYRPYTSAKQTLGFRVPDHETVRAIVRLLGSPIATTSANRSGEKSSARFADVERFKGEIPVMINGGDNPNRAESTVVDITGNAVTVLREGAISRERIEDVARV